MLKILLQQSGRFKDSRIIKAAILGHIKVTSKLINFLGHEMLQLLRHPYIILKDTS